MKIPNKNESRSGLSRYAGLIRSLDLYFLEIHDNGTPRAVSEALLQRLGYNDPVDFRKKNIDSIFDPRFCKFLREGNTNQKEPIRNYRTLLRNSDGKETLFQCWGHQINAETEGIYQFLLEELPQSENMRIDSGSFEENVRAFGIVRKYISTHLMDEAREAAGLGMDHILNRERELTFLFADLVSYTALAEKIAPDEIVAMLNVSIGAASATILHCGGFVDKIMGDSIFAVFNKPEDAIIAAIEIQKQFNLLNMFRQQMEQKEVQLRIGINTGTCIVASIGGGSFMEFTYIGDAVNVASRLEKASQPGAILASETSVEPIRKQLELASEINIKVKGKSEQLRAYYIQAITMDGPRGKARLGLDETIF